MGFRSGRSSLQESWASRVTWHQGNLLSSDLLKDALEGVTSVVCLFVLFAGIDVEI
jgi:hypothetical protein